MRILIADDHEIIRQGLRSLLSTDETWEICGEAVDGQDAVEKAHALKPDVVVMDISMPKMDGLQATRTIRETSPEVEIVILSQHDSKEMIRQAFKAGASGYVIKSAISNDLVAALQTVARHEIFSAEESASKSQLPMAGPNAILFKDAALERALRESEERFRWTFERAAVGMAHVSPGGQLLRVNQKLCQILGYTREEIVKIRLRDLTHPDDLAATLENLQKLRSGELDSFTLLKRYIRKDGGIVWATATLNVIRDSRGVPDYFMAVIYDVTAQKNAETALNTSIAETMMRLELAQYELRQKEEQLRVALAASDTATFRWSPDTGELLEFGDEAKRLFGFAAQESVTNTEQLLGHVHPDDVSTIIAAG